MDPPNPAGVGKAMNILREVGACEKDACKLTHLGHHLAALPVNCRIGKMLLFAGIFGCLEAIVSILMQKIQFFISTESGLLFFQIRPKGGNQHILVCY